MTTDIDIDVKDRDKLLEYFAHIPALNMTEDAKHNVGVYFQKIPENPLLGTASINYKMADDLGYFKIDVLNNTVYKDIESEEEINDLLSEEPVWDLLQHREVVVNLVHVNNHLDILQEMKPQSIEELAMVLAMIRPAKRHLVGKSWDVVKNDIWVEPDNDAYFFKKSHAIAYAHAIVVQLNKLVRELD